jgi:exonuclease SbcC
MNIILKAMSLINFKGIRNAEFNFNTTTNNISGDNATGKTTIVNAFLWCLFGKDIEDRKDYEIKTYDKDGVIIPQIDHSVELFIDVDFREITLKRVLSEKWQKKRGSDDLEFTGNETTYFWNEVPLKQSEYQSKIKDLIDEGLFKLLTNVNYFHTLHWEKRREIIFSLAGEITDSEILSESDMETDHSQIIGNILSHGKTMAEAKAETANKKKRIKDEIQFIPSRIDEAERSKPNPVYVKGLEDEKRILNTKLQSLQKDLQQVIDAETSFTERLALQNKEYTERLERLYKLKTTKFKLEKEIESDIRASYKNPENEINSLKREIEQIDISIVNLNSKFQNGLLKADEIEGKLTEKREQWKLINTEQQPHFDESSCKCPTCQQSLPAETIRLNKDEFIHNFNASKKLRLDKNVLEGKELVEERKTIEDLLQQLTLNLDAAQKEAESKKVELERLKKESEELPDIEKNIADAKATNNELQELRANVIELEKGIEDKPAQDSMTQELKERRIIIQNEVNDINIQINELSAKSSNQTQIKLIDARIEELKHQESTLAQELNRLEKIEFAILQFEKQRVNYIEEKINGKFEYVTFRMFETQINGQEVPCCKTLINGIPYESANTASKINAGLAIINTLSFFNNINAPIFIDNAESTNNFLETKSQIIKLNVTTDKQLTFKYK